MHTLIWEFHVKADCVAEFERAYGPEGAWVQFLRKGKGYLETELLKKDDGVYVTIDRWESREAYASFSEQHKAKYAELDRRCESLTVSEQLIGAFVDVTWKDSGRHS